MSTIWMTQQARDRLEAELVELLDHRDPGASAADRDESVIATWLARKARIREIHDLLSNAAVGSYPPDDGMAEPGMVVTVRYEDTGEEETFLLGVRGAEDAGIEVYSPNSPLGRALCGAPSGERREYTLPNGVRQTVTLLAAVPLSVHTRAATSH